MSLLNSHMLSSALTPPTAGGATAGRPMTLVETPPAEIAVGPKRRTPIWELHNSLHCSIIGTCLSTAELRRVLVRLQIKGADTANDHDLHMLGVLTASRPEGGAKLLQKALDRRHQAAISRFAKVGDGAALRASWQAALESGDIPGAFWAALTHPVTTAELVRQVFGDVHMLSHLVGAANRADIRRLRQLEAENVELKDTVDRQQRRLRDGFVARDATIRRLEDMLARKVAEPSAPRASPSEDRADLEELLAGLGRRLAHESVRRERLEQQLAAAVKGLSEAERSHQRLERERDALVRDLATIEARIGWTLTSSGSEPSDPERSDSDRIDLGGSALLYVGGRAHQVPPFRALVERHGGDFLHHDGGIEHAAALLPALVSRADAVVFPVDCVSHDAATAVKRLCGQSGKPWRALRTASLASLAAALAELQNVSVRDGIA
jgi:hypothetical protein